PANNRTVWRGTAALAVAETTSWGILYYSFGVLLAPLGTAVAASQATVAGAFSLALLVAGLTARPIGHGIERSGARPGLTWGARQCSSSPACFWPCRCHSMRRCHAQRFCSLPRPPPRVALPHCHSIGGYLPSSPPCLRFILSRQPARLYIWWPISAMRGFPSK